MAKAKKRLPICQNTGQPIALAAVFLQSANLAKGFANCTERIVIQTVCKAQQKEHLAVSGPAAVVVQFVWQRKLERTADMGKIGDLALCAKDHVLLVNGWQFTRVTSPTVEARTWARNRRDLTMWHKEVRLPSDHAGSTSRNRPGLGSSSQYQAMPNPSPLTASFDSVAE
jgi:hypothetical protein